MARVLVRGLTRKYPPATIAVDSLHFEARHQEFLTLLGPSGCGKSTTLRMIAGLEAPTSGQIAIGERIVNTLHPSERDIAMVFQSCALYPHMTVAENIGINLRLKKLPRAEIRSRVLDTARLLGIESMLDRKPRALSGGEFQRVALGRAIIRRPQVFLLDEPLSNLDAILREKMRAELKALFQQLGATVIHVTHDQTEAMTMSSKIAVMDQGKLQQLGTPADIYDRPANTFVAGFVGSPRMNFFAVRVVPGGLAIGDQKIRLSGPHMAALQGVSELTLGIRPENVSAGTGDLKARVRLAEPIGAFTVLDLEFAGQPVRALVDPRSHFSGNINIQFDPARFHFFDPDTGHRCEPWNSL